MKIWKAENESELRKAAKAILTQKLMSTLKSPGYCNFMSYCRQYADAVISNDLYYDEDKREYFNIDGGDDIEIPAHYTKSGNPATIDIPVRSYFTRANKPLPTKEGAESLKKIISALI